MLRRLLNDESGQDMIEYGLLIGIITVGAVVALKAIAPKVGGYFTTLKNNLP